MKQTLITHIITTLSFSSLARQTDIVSSVEQPGYVQGGFTGPAPTQTSVSQAKKQWDDAWVVLEGNIIRQVGHELYEFRDSSGTVYVDIDNKYWMGQTASPADKVHIEGEVDRDWDGIKIDVKNIRVMK
ncbi:YgiW/YdeI family stress tolerance OB fold protein [Salmonella enterica]|uniref:YgiW/YdeI family stress tolerance OB fold protein n=1 Tax=Salmonella enterica TaxID=28901 RepID=UPI001080E609|nr:YgiW/YdeI family stress tolerance OB fold protein [Salmonella enterica]